MNNNSNSMNNSISGIDQNYKKYKPKTSNLAKR